MLQALLVFVVAVLVLLRFAAPGLTFEDCGELAAAAAVWGVPHPPGYPLLTLVGGAFVRVGAIFGLEPARAMVLLSVLSAAGAVALVARFVERATWRTGAEGGGSHSVVPLAVTGLLLLSPTFRAQGLVVEAYALAAFCSAALLLAALCWRPAFVGLWFGLAVAAHPSGVFLFPLAVFGVLRAGERGRSVVRGAAGFALGSATWLYVPLAAAAKPAVNWGGIEGVDGLLDHLLRRQFGVTPERDLAAQAGFLAEHLVGQWPLVLGLALAIGGVLRRRHADEPTDPDPRGPSALGPALGLVGVTLLVTTLGLFWAQHWPVTEELTRVRLAGSFTPLVLLTAAGIGLLLERGLERGAPLLARLPGALLLLLVLVLGMVHVGPYGAPTLADFQDMGDVTEARTYAEELLVEPGPGDPRALVVNRLGYSDVLFFPLLYTKVVRGHGAGLLVVDRELLGAPWYRAELAAERPDLGPALDELGAAIDAAPTDPRSRRLAQVPFLRWLAGREGGLRYVGKPGPRLVEGLELSADARTWVVSAEPRPTSGADAGPSRPWLDRGRDLDVWRAELLREAEERDRFRGLLP